MREQGRISSWNQKGGYGFIRVGHGLYWVHIGELKKLGPVNEEDLVGTRVSFRYEAGPRGGRCPRALDIQLEGQNASE